MTKPEHKKSDHKKSDHKKSDYKEIGEIQQENNKASHGKLFLSMIV